MALIKPVTITRSDGQSATIGGREFRAGERPLPDESVENATAERLEERIRMTLLAAMEHAESVSQKISAASAAIKYLAVKAKIPLPVGGAFEEDPPEASGA